MWFNPKATTATDFQSQWHSQWCWVFLLLRTSLLGHMMRFFNSCQKKNTESFFFAEILYSDRAEVLVIPFLAGCSSFSNLIAPMIFNTNIYDIVNHLSNQWSSNSWTTTMTKTTHYRTPLSAWKMQEHYEKCTWGKQKKEKKICMWVNNGP